MKLEVRLFAGLKCNNKELPCYEQKEFIIEMPDNITVEQLHEYLGLESGDYKLIYLVNGLARSKEWVLNDNDRVGIFPPVGGG